VALVLLLSAPCRNRPRQKQRCRIQRNLRRGLSREPKRACRPPLQHRALHLRRGGLPHRPGGRVLDASARGTHAVRHQPSTITISGAATCTPSRGVMFSGQPPQVNGRVRPDGARLSAEPEDRQAEHGYDLRGPRLSALGASIHQIALPQFLELGDAWLPACHDVLQRHLLFNLLPELGRAGEDVDRHLVVLIFVRRLAPGEAVRI
jgi:hypothetical protein